MKVRGRRRGKTGSSWRLSKRFFIHCLTKDKRERERKERKKEGGREGKNEKEREGDKKGREEEKEKGRGRERVKSSGGTGWEIEFLESQKFLSGQNSKAVSSHLPYKDTAGLCVLGNQQKPVVIFPQTLCLQLRL